MKKSAIIAAVSTLVLIGATSLAAAQQPPPIKRIPLQKYDVPGTELETVVGIAEIAPNVLIGRHTHPGPESGYLLEGEFVLMIDGQPPKPLKAGESYQIAIRRYSRCQERRRRRQGFGSVHRAQRRAAGDSGKVAQQFGGMRVGKLTWRQ